MTRLRQSDMKALLAFVGECYKIHDFEQFTTHVVSALPRLIPAEHVTYNEMDPQQSKSRNWVNTPQMATPKAAGLWEQHMNEHPVMVHILKTGDRHAVRISDFWSRRQLHDRGLHSDFYRHFDIEDALCITVPCPSPGVIGIGWHDKRYFTDRERLMADLVRPHLTQAWKNVAYITQMQSQLRLLRQGLASAELVAVICNADGRAEFVAPAARLLLAEYFGEFPASDGSLPLELVHWVRHHKTQLTHSDVPPPRLPLILQKGKKRLIVRLFTDAGIDLLLLEEEQTAPDAASLDTLGLTRREAEVLSWVAQGKTNGEIGIILGMNVLTVKKHLEHIFTKLGVETRTAAAALALKCKD